MFFQRFGLMVPARYRRHMEKLLVYAGDRRPAEHVLGISVLLGIFGFFSASILMALFFLCNEAKRPISWSNA